MQEVMELDFYNLFEKENVWIHIHRNTTNAYEPFEWKYYDIGYGKHYQDFNLYNCTDNLNCVTVKFGKYTPTNCAELNSGLCVYPYAFEEISKYCQDNYNTDNSYDSSCMANSLNVEKHKCYCRKSVENDDLKQSCHKLAEPLEKFQTKLLIEELQIFHDYCTFGMYKSDEGDYRWVSSNRSVNYSYWSEDVDFSNNIGSIKFTNSKGWVLVNDQISTDCQICEIDNIYNKNVTLRLKYLSSKSIVELKIENPLELSNYFGKYYLLYCFVGPLEDEFKKKVSDAIIKFDRATQDISIIHLDKFVNLPYPAYYWCEAFQHPQLTHLSSQKLLLRSNVKGNDYSLRCIARVDFDPYVENDHYITCRYIQIELMRQNFKAVVRPMQILNYTNNNNDRSIELIIHLTVISDFSDVVEYQELSTVLYSLLHYDSLLTIIYFRRSDICLKETTQTNNKNLTWPITAIGSFTLSLELCIKENGEPIRRQCGGNFLTGGIWQHTNESCSDIINPSEHTLELHQLLNNDTITSKELTENLLDITKGSSKMDVIDVYLISKNIEKLETYLNDTDMSDVTKIISNVMNIDTKTLKQSQNLLNCTDRILNSLDNIINYQSGNVILEHIISEKVLIQISDIRVTNIIGAALEKLTEDDIDFETYKLVPIYKNVSNEVWKDNTELLILLPNDLISEIHDCFTVNASIKFIVQLFFNDALFNEHIETNRTVNSKIVNLNVPNYDCSFNSRFGIYFRPLHNTTFKKRCSFWNYGMDDAKEHNIQGGWLEDGIIKENVTICHFDHMTHFALLMMGRHVKKDVGIQHIIALNIITAIGSILSLICMIMIFTIALIWKEWRQRSSNKILLNFSVALTLQIIFLYVAGSTKIDGIGCIISGAILHYSILTQFFWMLTIAVMQYRKFVVVFRYHSAHLIRKLCFLCWGIPLIPVTIFLAIGNDSYYKSPYGLCYPSDIYLYVGIVLPIFIIILFNIVIFAKIFQAICCKKTKAYGEKSENAKFQCLLAVFLFFLMGLTWSFGFGTLLFGKLIFSYLFCLTATFQGFVIFVFYMVINKDSTILCSTVKKCCVCCHCTKMPHSSSQSSIREELSF